LFLGSNLLARYTCGQTICNRFNNFLIVIELEENTFFMLLIVLSLSARVVSRFFEVFVRGMMVLKRISLFKEEACLAYQWKTESDS